MSELNAVMSYSILQFSPFIETEEFANVGVVLSSPKHDYFDFRLQGRKHARVTKFFEPIDPQVYRTAMRVMKNELARIKRLVGRGDYFQSKIDFGEYDYTRMLFADLMRKREGTLRFGDARPILGQRPEAKLEELFRHYVDREFVTPTYNERLLELEVRQTLKDHSVSDRFSSRRVGDATYEATFPFVESSDGHVTKIIKPFFLAQGRPEAIIDHGVKWSYTVRRLRKAGILPKEVLFPVKGPEGNGKRETAFREATDLLKEASITIVPMTDKDSVLRYVLH